jgi:hypothetical protein
LNGQHNPLPLPFFCFWAGYKVSSFALSYAPTMMCCLTTGPKDQDRWTPTETSELWPKSSLSLSKLIISGIWCGNGDLTDIHNFSLIFTSLCFFRGPTVCRPQKHSHEHNKDLISQDWAPHCFSSSEDQVYHIALPLRTGWALKPTARQCDQHQLPVSSLRLSSCQPRVKTIRQYPF